MRLLSLRPYSMAEQASIFTKIIRGDIPCHLVHKDAKTIAFMDIAPVQPGMVLVVPAAQVDNFEDLSQADYAALWDSVRLVARKLRVVFPKAKKIAVQVEGLDVAHAHVKLFPFDTADQFRALAPTQDEPDHSALAALAERISRA